jgi:hypothetical protein
VWVPWSSSYGNCSGFYNLLDLNNLSHYNHGDLIFLQFNVLYFQERLEREYNLNLIITAPSVVYRVNCANNETVSSMMLNFFTFLWIYLLLTSIWKITPSVSMSVFVD